MMNPQLCDPDPETKANSSQMAGQWWRRVFSSPKKIALIYFIGLAGVALLTVTSIFFVGSIKTEYSIDQFLPSDHPLLAGESAVQRKFFLPSVSPILLTIQLAKEIERVDGVEGAKSADWLSVQKMGLLEKFSDRLTRLEGVESVFSLATVEGATNTDEGITVGRLARLTPVKEWAQRFLNDPLTSPTLISRDGQTVLVRVQADATKPLLATGGLHDRIRDLAKQSFPEASVSLGGVPVVQNSLKNLLQSELLLFCVLSALACALMIGVTFRGWSVLFIAFFLVIVCNLISVAAMVGWGLPFTLLSSTVPILVFITVVAIVIHSALRLHRIETLNDKSAVKTADAATNTDVIKSTDAGHRWLSIFAAWKDLLQPSFLASFTTCVGFLSLLTSDVQVIRSYGLAVALGVLISWLVVTASLPSLFWLLPRSRPRVWTQKKAWWVSRILLHDRRWVAGIAAMAVIFFFVGQNLNWSPRLFDDLPENHEARQSSARIDQEMGGIIPLHISIAGEGTSDHWKDPTRLARLDELIAQVRSLDVVGTIVSLPDFLHSSRLLPSSEGPTGSLRRGLASTMASAELFFLYSLSQNNPLRHFVTTDDKTVRVEMRLHDQPAQVLSRAVDHVRSLAEEYFPGDDVKIVGMGASVHELNALLSKELINGFWKSLLVIALFLALVFRSIKWSLLSCIPNLLPPTALLGVLAWTQTPIKPSIAILFSIALGLAFDNTVYLLSRLRKNHREGKKIDFRNLYQTFSEEIPPCLISTSIVFVGFAVFLFSNFSTNQTFGMYMLVSIVAGLVGDAVLLPAFLGWSTRKGFASTQSVGKPMENRLA